MEKRHEGLEAGGQHPVEETVVEGEPRRIRREYPPDEESAELADEVSPLPYTAHKYSFPSVCACLIPRCHLLMWKYHQ